MVQWITKGWVCGIAEKDSDCLGSLTGLHTKEHPAKCKKVSGYSLFREGAANAAGKEPIEALINL
jgi:hypothetical protein